MLMLSLIIIAGVIAIIWIISYERRAVKRRRAIAADPFPRSWRKVLNHRMPYFFSMPADLQLQLKKHIQIFIAEKEFIGCEGLIVDDEIKVTVAAQACLLLLNRPTDFYPNLKQVLIYPAAFITENENPDHTGIIWYQQRVLQGESWSNGKVILSWRDTVVGASKPYNGHNVVIHEFAHQLDQEAGQANGAPLLMSSKEYQQWAEVLSREYETLKWCAASQHPSLFNYYGATNPAEFFAVITEAFFEKSTALHQQHPQLYRQLSRYYHLDPINWH